MSSTGSHPPKIVIVITGASRGFGRALALVASQSNFTRATQEVSSSAVRLVLVARSSTGLQETKTMVESKLASCGAVGRNVQISCHAVDLSDLDTLDTNLNRLIEEDLQEDVNEIILFNNAGSIGYIGPSIDSPSLADMRSNVDLNVTSALWTSVRFARLAKERSIPAILINVSSLVAISDFPTFGIYSTGKAARDKFHALISKESSSSSSSIRTLNYAPGPLETEMVEEIRNADELDSGLKPHFHRQLLDPVDSAKKVMRLLVSNSFEDGAHLDYYDLPE